MDPTQVLQMMQMLGDPKDGKNAEMDPVMMALKLSQQAQSGAGTTGAGEKGELAQLTQMMQMLGSQKGGNTADGGLEQMMTMLMGQKEAGKGLSTAGDVPSQGRSMQGDSKAGSMAEGEGSLHDEGMMKGLLGMMKGLQGSDETMTECPQGEERVPKKAHQPTGNGCGTSAFNVVSERFDFEECCTYTHDVCYSTCGMAKQECEELFSTCLAKTCNNYTDAKGCHDLAGVYTQVTGLMGGSYWKQGQSEACECLASENAPKHRQGRLEEFYKKWAPDQMDKVENLMQKYSAPGAFPRLLLMLHQKYRDAVKITGREEGAMTISAESALKMFGDAKEAAGNQDSLNRPASTSASKEAPAGPRDHRESKDARIQRLEAAVQRQEVLLMALQKENQEQKLQIGELMHQQTVQLRALKEQVDQFQEQPPKSE
jgi:hypothetical protein